MRIRTSSTGLLAIGPCVFMWRLRSPLTQAAAGPFWKNLQSKWHLLQRQLAAEAETKAYKTDEVRTKAGHFASEIGLAAAHLTVFQAFLQFAEAQELP